MVLTLEHRAICRHKHGRHLQRHSLRLLDQTAEQLRLPLAALAGAGLYGWPATRAGVQQLPVEGAVLAGL
jgi:hypothetical protein